MAPDTLRPIDNLSDREILIQLHQRFTDHLSDHAGMKCLMEDHEKRIGDLEEFRAKCDGSSQTWDWVRLLFGVLFGAIAATVAIVGLFLKI